MISEPVGVWGALFERRVDFLFADLLDAWLEFSANTCERDRLAEATLPCSTSIGLLLWLPGEVLAVFSNDLFADSTVPWCICGTALCGTFDFGIEWGLVRLLSVDGLGFGGIALTN